MNEQIQSLATSDAMRIAMPVVMALVGFIVAMNTYQQRRIISRIDKLVADQAQVARYRERIDNVQRSQELLNKLTTQMQHTITRNTYRLDTLESATRYRVQNTRPKE